MCFSMITNSINQIHLIITDTNSTISVKTLQIEEINGEIIMKQIEEKIFITNIPSIQSLYPITPEFIKLFSDKGYSNF